MSFSINLKVIGAMLCSVALSVAATSDAEARNSGKRGPAKTTSPVVKNGVLQPLGGAKKGNKQVRKKVAKGKPTTRQANRNKNRKNRRNNQGKKLPKPKQVGAYSTWASWTKPATAAERRNPRMADYVKLKDAIQRVNNKENAKKGFWTPLSSAVVNTAAPPPVPPRKNR